MQPSSWPWEPCVRRGCSRAEGRPRISGPGLWATSAPGPQALGPGPKSEEPFPSAKGAVTVAAALFPRNPRAGSLHLTLPGGKTLAVNATLPLQSTDLPGLCYSQ